MIMRQYDVITVDIDRNVSHSNNSEIVIIKMVV